MNEEGSYYSSSSQDDEVQIDKESKRAQPISKELSIQSSSEYYSESDAA